MEDIKILLQESLVRAIPGVLSAHQSDPVFIVKKSYPLKANQQLPLYPKSLAAIMLRWAGFSLDKERQKEDILVFDLETTGLERSGNIPILIGLGYYEDENFTVEQIFLPHFDAELNALDYLLDRLKKHSLLISFNGKSFDLPIFKTRYLYYQTWVDFERYEHLDILHLARRLWRKRLPSCALESLEYYILGQVREKELEIEGRDIPHSYFQYLMQGDCDIISKILTHNHKDILYTAALFSLISDAVIYPPQARDARIDYHALALLYESQGEAATAKGILLDLYQDGEISPEILCKLGMLYKKEGDLEQALHFFAAATDLHEPLAILEYAKLLERKKDYAKALEIAKKLEAYEKGRALKNHRAIADVEKRITRLKTKREKLALKT